MGSSSLESESQNERFRRWKKNGVIRLPVSIVAYTGRLVLRASLDHLSFIELRPESYRVYLDVFSQ